MSVNLIAQIAAQIVGSPGGDPVDVENDVAEAAAGTLNVHVLSVAGNGGFLTVEPLVLPEHAIAPPAAPTLLSFVSGALTGATYYAKTTYLNALGETLGSVESSHAVATNSVLKVTSPAAYLTATHYNVYASTGTGTETLQNVSPIAIGTDWTMPNSGLVSGAALPVANTTGLTPGPCTITITQGAGTISITPAA